MDLLAIVLLLLPLYAGLAELRFEIWKVRKRLDIHHPEG